MKDEHTWVRLARVQVLSSPQRVGSGQVRSCGSRWTTVTECYANISVSGKLTYLEIDSAVNVPLQV